MADTIPTFVPGDYITYVVYLAYPGNLTKVEATFRNEKETSEGPSVRHLTWEAERTSYWSETDWEEQLAPNPERNMVSRKVSRTHVAVLSLRVEEYFDPGTYRLEKLEATTYGGKELTINTLLRFDAFRIEQEPDISALPFTAVLPPTGFHLPEGHPDRPQGE
jgi:hypothetical protein